MATKKSAAETVNAPRKRGRPAKKKKAPKAPQTPWDKALAKVKAAHLKVKSAQAALKRAEEALHKTPKE